MMILRILAALRILTGSAVLLLPLTALGAVFTVLSTCALLALIPLSVERMMTVEI